MIRLNTLLIPPVKWPSWVWKLFRQFRCKSKPIGTPSLGFQLKFQRGWGCPFHQSQFCRARYPPNIWTANHCKHIAVHQKISENPTKHHFFSKPSVVFSWAESVNFTNGAKRPAPRTSSSEAEADSTSVPESPATWRPWRRCQGKWPKKSAPNQWISGKEWNLSHFMSFI